MKNNITDDLILFISGIPSAGKTTISYELLKKYNLFRIVQETDILREILRGYNEYIAKSTALETEKIENIHPHTELLSYYQAKEQCNIMKYSIKEIVKRQKRRQIPTIINGVHIIPEILFEFINFPNIKYVTLFFDSEDDLFKHLKERDANKYGKKCVPFLFEMNIELQKSIEDLRNKYPDIFLSINVGKHTIKETLDMILNHIQNNN